MKKKKVRLLLQNEINEAKELIDRYENVIARLDVLMKTEKAKSSGKRLVLKNGNWYPRFKEVAK